MSVHQDERRDDAGDRRFVDRFRKAWGPVEFSPRAATAFSARLLARVDGGGRRRLGLPTLIGVAVVAAMAVAVWIGRVGSLPDVDWLASLADAESVLSSSTVLDAEEATDDAGVDGDATDADNEDLELNHEYQMLLAWVAPSDQELEDGWTP
ncbi:MAG: hypothetical protein HY903_06175 [Deltaproteobacteria bacterium]|nr:hypothetical protein [Deltaproteobacteria bacterium]